MFPCTSSSLLIKTTFRIPLFAEEESLNPYLNELLETFFLIWPIRIILQMFKLFILLNLFGERTIVSSGVVLNHNLSY